MDQLTQTTAFFLFSFIVSAAAQTHPAVFGFQKVPGEGDRWVKPFDPDMPELGGLGMTIAPDGSAHFYTSFDNVSVMPLNDDEGSVKFMGRKDFGRTIPIKGWLTNAGGPQPSQKSQGENTAEKEHKSTFSRFSPKSIGGGAVKGAKVAIRIVHADNSFKDPNGQAVSKWTPGMEVDPQELGSYEQGDVLFPSPDPRKKWPDGIVPYEINPKIPSKNKDLIKKAMEEFHRRTCIKWVPRKDEFDYIYFDNQETGCWSFVGRIMGRQELNLQNPGCVYKVSTPEHEMMHALGFDHEQNRAERDKFVNVLYENVIIGKEHNFIMAPKHAADAVAVPYDFRSIMHYNAKAFSKNDQPTIVPKVEGVELGGKTDGMSDIDVDKINRFYSCTK